MLFEQLDGWLWLLLSLGPLLFLQRALHYEIQADLLLITRRTDVTAALFSILFFPGILLHELSHFLMAKILFVKTGKISLLPKVTKEGRIQLGYVETSISDPIRDTLIGIAPLITGGAFVAYAGLKQMGFKSLGYSAMDVGPVGMFNLLPGLTSRPDFWIWFYLTFTVSSTMLPSSSDRKSWLTIGIWLGMLLLISLLVGVGPWLLNNVTPVINRIMTSIAVVFLISDVVHFLLWLPSWLFHRLLNKLTGLEVTNQKS